MTPPMDHEPMLSDEPTTTSHDYGELRKRMSAAVRKVCPIWMASHHEDLIQLGVMKMHRLYSEAQINTTLIYRVAHSVVIDEIRRQKRRQEVQMTPTTPERVAGPSHHTPEARLTSDSVGQQIDACLERLSEDRRRAVTLYLLGHSVPQVGEYLGFGLKKAENLVFRGLSDLRRHLKSEGLAPCSKVASSFAES